MSNLDIAFYVVGALFALYVVAATWRSRDAEPRERRRDGPRSQSR
jgi:hypothetical protein